MAQALLPRYAEAQDHLVYRFPHPANYVGCRHLAAPQVNAWIYLVTDNGGSFSCSTCDTRKPRPEPLYRGRCTPVRRGRFLAGAGWVVPSFGNGGGDDDGSRELQKSGSGETEIGHAEQRQVFEVALTFPMETRINRILLGRRYAIISPLVGAILPRPFHTEPPHKESGEVPEIRHPVQSAEDDPRINAMWPGVPKPR